MPGVVDVDGAGVVGVKDGPPEGRQAEIRSIERTRVVINTHLAYILMSTSSMELIGLDSPGHSPLVKLHSEYEKEDGERSHDGQVQTCWQIALILHAMSGYIREIS